MSRLLFSEISLAKAQHRRKMAQTDEVKRIVWSAEPFEGQGALALLASTLTLQQAAGLPPVDIADRTARVINYLKAVQANKEAQQLDQACKDWLANPVNKAFEKVYDDLGQMRRELQLRLAGRDRLASLPDRLKSPLPTTGEGISGSTSTAGTARSDEFLHPVKVEHWIHVTPEDPASPPLLNTIIAFQDTPPFAADTVRSQATHNPKRSHAV